MVFRGFCLSVKGLKGWCLVLISMESIAENLIVITKRRCTSCKVEKSEGFFIKRSCVASFWKTCLLCRESKTKYRDKVKSYTVIIRPVSSSTTPADYFGPVPP